MSAFFLIEEDLFLKQFLGLGNGAELIELSPSDS